MEELNDLISEYFARDTRYHTLAEIKKALKIKSEKQETILESVLNTLIENCTIFYDKKYGYRNRWLVARQ